MSALETLAPSNDPADDVAVGAERLSLLQRVSGERTTLDGAWWPRSRDLAREIPSLAAALDEQGIRVTRVIYNPGTWLPAPHKLWPAGRRINLGWFTEMDQHLVGLRTVLQGRLELLVIPPDTDPDVAARALATASSPRNQLPASAVLEAAAG
jgi:hypothetical protein